MKRFIPIVLSAMILQGCAAVALTAGSMAAGAGIDHTLSGITYKTFSASMNELRLATLKTLHRMDIRVTADTRNEAGRQIIGAALEREIEIEFEAVTRRTTRMRVVVSKGMIFKDGATATEIIIQTAVTLDNETSTARMTP